MSQHLLSATGRGTSFQSLHRRKVHFCDAAKRRNTQARLLSRRNFPCPLAIERQVPKSTAQGASSKTPEARKSFGENAVIGIQLLVLVAFILPPVV